MRDRKGADYSSLFQENNRFPAGIAVFPKPYLYLLFQVFFHLFLQLRYPTIIPRGVLVLWYL